MQTSISRAWCAVFVIALAAPLPAFKIPTHRDITAAALKATGFSDIAIVEIQNANECVDQGPVLYSTEDQADVPCVPAAGVSIDQQLGAPDEHFDDEQFLVGIARVRALRKQILMMVNEKRYVQARKLLGAATHTIQDFYAHTNWVELGNTDIFPVMDSGTMPISFDPRGDPNKGTIRFAGEKEDVCEFDEVQDPETGQWMKQVRSADLLPKAKSGGYVLTSGYFFAVVPGYAAAANAAKCTHGAIFDGINKDTATTKHGKESFLLARQLATKHSYQYIKGILDELLGNDEAIRELTRPLFFVDARLTNPVGLTVTKGDVLRFRTTRNQTIVWGRDGVLQTGEERTSGPEGVDARGYFWYVTPPIPDRGVGALIGEIQPVVACGSETMTSRAPDASCPPVYFYIGAGGDITMPADGKLFLRVNDANLNNNRRGFMVEYTLVGKAQK